MAELEARPIEELIERWRVHPRTQWAEIVGHERQIRRLRELAAKIALSPEERTRLGLRLGSGLVLTGPSGTGKTQLARAFAAELDRAVIAPPVSELDPERIGALYRALAGTPSVIIIDEAEVLVGDPDWHSTDEAAQRALLGALDGVERPEAGPVTIAITAADVAHLSDQATRPGRLAPRLTVDRPSGPERVELLRRATAGLPGAAGLDLVRIAERLVGWSGAEIVGLAEEAMTHSLLLEVPGPGTELAYEAPGLSTELVLETAVERFVVRDRPADEARDHLLTSRHEAGHTLWAHLAWGPGAVAVVDIDGRGGSTTLTDAVLTRRSDRAELRRRAGLALAGAAAERIAFGRDGMSRGSEDDLAGATQLLVRIEELDVPFSHDALEGFQGRGSEAMRRDRYEAVRTSAAVLWDEVLDRLRLHAGAIERLGDAILAAPAMTLSGEELERAIEAAL
jgi:ATP-dependent Zn protease